MKTTFHQILFTNAQNLSEIENESINLVVTSPPYPMIDMWDSLFCSQNSAIEKALDSGDGILAFELMHQELDKVWRELVRILKIGGIVCINVGGATRTIRKNFTLYPSHSRITSKFIEFGMLPLPEILWRKQTNAPNKFMGSGMLPPGAYVTLEHEYILVFRKGGKRIFSSAEEKQLRRESAYFWEERNMWFSDSWEFKGAKQIMKKENTRDRSAAYPFELAYRLINMFSVKEDIILDPFLGTGTTTLAAIAAERNSIGIEIEQSFEEIIQGQILNCLEMCKKYIKNRIKRHNAFVEKRLASGKNLKYTNEFHKFPVVTKQETKLRICNPTAIKEKEKNSFVVEYE